MPRRWNGRCATGCATLFPEVPMGEDRRSNFAGADAPPSPEAQPQLSDAELKLQARLLADRGQSDRGEDSAPDDERKA